ncbi:MAG: nitrate reductase [Cellvibrio sp.]|jgi:nitrate reductase NapE|nr:nitrate reductase [Cellvibrio sp.]MDF3012351.1 nitrate reductase [Cellvibrio sp.]
MQDNTSQSLPAQQPLLTAEQTQQKKREWRLFIFIIVFLFPILTVALVSAMGFSIWFYQLIAGPPGAG